MLRSLFVNRFVAAANDERKNGRSFVAVVVVVVVDDVANSVDIVGMIAPIDDD
jgi:hypothetical protein